MVFVVLCSWWQKVAHLWSISFCLCQAPTLPVWGDTVNTSDVFWAAYYWRKLQPFLTRLLLSTSIPLLPFRMGLEALVESYAFWRPSLRTLTFEDIPGIPKQGKTQSLLGHIYSRFLTGSLGTGKLHLSSWAPTMATSSPTSSCDRIHLFSVRSGDGDQKNGSCGRRLSLACFRLCI